MDAISITSDQIRHIFDRAYQSFEDRHCYKFKHHRDTDSLVLMILPDKKQIKYLCYMTGMTVDEIDNCNDVNEIIKQIMKTIQQRHDDGTLYLRHTNLN